MPDPLTTKPTVQATDPETAAAEINRAYDALARGQR